MTSQILPDELLTILRTTFSRAKPSTISELGLDLTALALRLRTGCLLDKLSLDEAHARRLGQALYKLGPSWQNLAVVYEPLSQQSLVVDIDSVQRRLRACEWPAFVEVANSSPTIPEGPPDDLFTCLDNILAPADGPGFRLLSLPHPRGETDLGRLMVPLVGYLLEYPVVYTFECSLDGRSNCLGGRDLTLAQVWLRAPGQSSPHLLLSFSAPTQLLAPDGPLPCTSAELYSTLFSTYSARLAAARASSSLPVGWDSVEVAVHGGVVQDRFAL